MAVTSPVSSVLEASPTGVQAWLDRAVGLAQGEDPEADGGVVAALLAQPAGGERLLEGQRPAVEGAGRPGRRGVRTTRVQVPWTFMPCWPLAVGAKTVASDSWGS